MSETAVPSATFAAIAPRVMGWVWLRRWLALLGRSLWIASVVIVLAGAVAWVWRPSAAVWAVWLSVATWLVAAAAVVWRTRPGAYSALALWDQAKGRREAFAAAWWFEHQAQPLSAAAQLHVETQQAELGAALPELRRDLPLRPNRWLALPLACALLLTSFNVALRRPADVLLVDDAMRQKALEEAQKLARGDFEKKNLEGLKADEQKELEQLKENLKQTAQNLEQAGGKDAREVMSDLERRARDAEKLAQRLGADKDAWASDKLVKSLREHADTAELGDALASKDAAHSAAASENLAKQLRAPDLTNDARERMDETLKDTAANAEQEDRQRLAGQHVLGAGDRLRENQAPQAGSEFQKLADKMRDLARREQTRKELEKLAQQLRDAGSNIAGQNQAGGMQQMAAAAQQQNQSGQQGQTPQVGQAQAGQMGQTGQGQQALQPPGLGQMGQAQQQMMMNPVPGTGQQQGQQQQLLMAEGQPGQKGQGQPMLFAPIPGAKPGEQPTAFFLGPPGQNPSGQMMGMASSGGLEAGVGKADLNADPTGKIKTQNQAVVTPQQGNEGQSSVRAVEGGTRQEQAGRTASQVAVDFIQAEEEALDEAALPPSRREQIRRYFTELRRRFEAGARE